MRPENPLKLPAKLFKTHIILSQTGYEMLRIISLLIATAIATATLAISAGAQDSGATIKITPFSVEGFVKGTRYDIGAEFSAEHNIPVPAPFTFIAPRAKTHLVGTEPAPGGTGIFKVHFVTLEKAPKSNIQFVPYTVDMGEAANRLESSKRILQQAFVASVVDPERAEINVTRQIEIGPYAAVESIGRYDGGADGLVVLRIVAIPNPDSTDSMLVIINALSKNLPMETVEDILKTDASRALGTFRFR